jgi:hypothetical protein
MAGSVARFDVDVSGELADPQVDALRVGFEA